MVQERKLEKSLEIKFTHFKNLEEVPGKYKEILDSAVVAYQNSYAPYSLFRVGACLLLEDGNLILGANIENASYPLCMCAERNAIAKLSFDKLNQKIMAIAIVADNKNALVSPCGACRQVLAEMETRQNSPIKVIFQGENGSFFLLDGINSILPFSFNSNSLPK